jgi:hypothetical protein
VIKLHCKGATARNIHQQQHLWTRLLGPFTTQQYTVRYLSLLIVTRPIGTTNQAGIAWQASGGQCSSSSSEQPYRMCCTGAEGIIQHTSTDHTVLHITKWLGPMEWWCCHAKCFTAVCWLWSTPAALTGCPSLCQLQRNTQLPASHLQVCIQTCRTASVLNRLPCSGVVHLPSQPEWHCIPRESALLWCLVQSLRCSKRRARQRPVVFLVVFHVCARST